jgi:putative transposase
MPRARDQRSDVLWLEVEVRGMEVSEAQRLKAMEDENRRLKLLVAELSLHGEALKAVIRKNGWSLPV